MQVAEDEVGNEKPPTIFWQVGFGPMGPFAAPMRLGSHNTYHWYQIDGFIMVGDISITQRRGNVGSLNCSFGMGNSVSFVFILAKSKMKLLKMYLDNMSFVGFWLPTYQTNFLVFFRWTLSYQPLVQSIHKTMQDDGVHLAALPSTEFLTWFSKPCQCVAYSWLRELELESRKSTRLPTHLRG